MQVEIPKPKPVADDYEFVLGEFLSENWFFLLAFLLIVAIVIFYNVYRKQQQK